MHNLNLLRKNPFQITFGNKFKSVQALIENSKKSTHIENSKNIQQHTLTLE